MSNCARSPMPGMDSSRSGAPISTARSIRWRLAHAWVGGTTARMSSDRRCCTSTRESTSGSGSRPKSTSSASTCATTSAVPTISTRTDAAGSSDRNWLSAAGSRKLTSVSVAQTRTLPPTFDAGPASDVAVVAMSSRTRSAQSASWSAASVGTTRRPTRWNNGTPSSRSSRRSCLETDGWATCSAAAAAVTLPVRRTARR